MQKRARSWPAGPYEYMQRLRSSQFPPTSNPTNLPIHLQKRGGAQTPDLGFVLLGAVAEPEGADLVWPWCCLHCVDQHGNLAAFEVQQTVIWEVVRDQIRVRSMYDIRVGKPQNEEVQFGHVCGLFCLFYLLMLRDRLQE